ncbi:hypothetical protein [Pseudorhodoferax sp.]|uniref:hypothetical protein n=1 Tax=Pseudorhodoferax sp. TaxID=1993553 RepID=UPI0039E55F0B
MTVLPMATPHRKENSLPRQCAGQSGANDLAGRAVATVGELLLEAQWLRRVAQDQ